jgi:hypothetical protein
MRTALSALLALLALAACDRKPAPAKEAASASATPATGSTPLVYERTTPAAHVKLILPASVAATPALYAKLYSEGVNDLNAFADGAKEGYEELKAVGEPIRAFERELNWKVTGETPRLLGLELEEYENTGGAHPNAMLGSLVWDKRTGKALKPLDLMRGDANSLRLDAMVCDALHAAKKARTGSGELQADQRCPIFSDVKVTLERSTVAGKAGGLRVLFSPYEIGPWAEGSYELSFPIARLAGDINPDYAAEFGGAPPPEPKGR